MKNFVEELKCKYWKWRIKSDRGRRNFIIACIATYDEDTLKKYPLELCNEDKRFVWEIMRKCHILMGSEGSLNG